MADITLEIIEELELGMESVICSKEILLRIPLSLAELLHLYQGLENDSHLAVSRVVREHISQSLEANKGKINAQHDFLTGILDVFKLSEKRDPRDPTGGGECLQEELEDVVADNLGLREANNRTANDIKCLQPQLDRSKSAANQYASKGARRGVQGSFVGASNIDVPVRTEWRPVQFSSFFIYFKFSGYNLF